jgi:hypothetical protein
MLMLELGSLKVAGVVLLVFGKRFIDFDDR